MSKYYVSHSITVVCVIDWIWKKVCLCSLALCSYESVVQQGFFNEFAFDNKALETFVKFGKLKRLLTHTPLCQLNQVWQVRSYWKRKWYHTTLGFSSLKFITVLEIHSVERGICPIANSTMNELFLYYGRMHCACTKRPYFHFRSKNWCHHCVPLPQFPQWCRNFGNSAINKGYIAYFSLRMRKTAVFPLPV